MGIPATFLPAKSLRTKAAGICWVWRWTENPFSLMATSATVNLYGCCSEEWKKDVIKHEGGAETEGRTVMERERERERERNKGRERWKVPRKTLGDDTGGDIWEKWIRRRKYTWKKLSGTLMWQRRSWINRELKRQKLTCGGFLVGVMHFAKFGDDCNCTLQSLNLNGRRAS